MGPLIVHVLHAVYSVNSQRKPTLLPDHSMSRIVLTTVLLTMSNVVLKYKTVLYPSTLPPNFIRDR